MEMQEFTFATQKTINTIRFEEEGNKVDNVRVEALINGEFVKIYEQDEVGKRVGVIDPVKTSTIRVYISSKEKGVTINNIEFDYIAPIKREKPFKVVSYVVGPFRDDVEKLFDGRLNTTTDAILIGYVNFDDKGNLVERKGFENLGKDIQTLKAAIKKNGCKTNLWICLGGYEGPKENVDKIFSTKKIRDNFVAQSLELIKKYDFVGADIDFEYPSNDVQWDGYDKVLIALKKELVKINKKVSIALPSWGVNFSKDCIEAIDEVQMMQYDLFDEKRRHAPYECFVYGIEYFKKLGFDVDKLNPGLALYGREKDKEAFERWLTYEKAASEYADIFDKNTNELDGTYFTGQTMNNDKTYIAIEKGCCGVMAFHFGCDLPYDNELSIYKGINNTINRFIVKGE